MTLRSMLAKILEVVERDYAGVIKRKMEGVYAIQSGGNQERGGERDRREKEQRSSFIVRDTARLCIKLLILADLPE